MAAAKGSRFWGAGDDNKSFIAEIQHMTIREGRLLSLIQADFWRAFSQVLPPALTVLMNNEVSRIGTEVEADGEAFFATGWMLFMDKHDLEWGNCILFRYIGGGRMTADLVPELDDQEEYIKDDDEVMEVIELSDDEAPAHRGRGRQPRPRGSLVDGSHFGCIMPEHRKGSRELSFAWSQFPILQRQRTRGWTIIDHHSGDAHEVQLLRNEVKRRSILGGGWIGLRRKLDIKHGDILSFTIVDAAEEPTMMLHIQRA